MASLKRTIALLLVGICTMSAGKIVPSDDAVNVKTGKSQLDESQREFALEDGAFTAVKMGDWTIMINQEMADRISPADLLPTAEELADNDGDVVVVKSMDEAVQMIRNAMAERRDSVRVEIVNEFKPYADWHEWYAMAYDDWEKSVSDAMAQDLMAHTGVPYEGDYIQYQQAGWGYSYGTDLKVIDDKLVTFIECVFEGYYSTAEDEDQMNVQVPEVIASLGFTPLTSKFEKIIAIHDWICTHVTYDNEHLNDETYLRKHSAAAALLDGTAVCQGYALLFYRLCLECGVDTRYISGWGFDGKEWGAHGWNIADPGDGRYYYVDTTWDDAYFEAGIADGYYTYLLKGSDTDPFGVDHMPKDGFLDALGESYAVSATDFDPSTLPMIGDLNGDNKVDYIDLTILARYLAGWEMYKNLPDTADVSGDGYVTPHDRVTLARYLNKYAFTK